MTTDDDARVPPLRAGVIGLGWAGQQHVAAYAETPGVNLVALAAQEEHLLAEYGEAHQVPIRTTDWRELLDADLDVLSIATPTFLHAPMTISALQSGIHVLCEKPMAEHAEAAERMVRAAEQAGRVLDVAFNHRQRGEVQALKQVIDSGVLGRIYYAKTGWLRRAGIPGLGTWFTKNERAGGGALMDIGVHMLDMTLHLMGEPEVITASAATHAEFGPLGRGGSGFGVSELEEGSPFEVEDLATAFLRLDGGATLLLESSWAQWIPYDQCYVMLYGSEGGASIEWGGTGRDPYERLNVWTEVSGVPAELAPHVGPHGRHAAAVTGFLAKVRSGAHPQYTGRDALHRARVLDACYASAGTGTEVRLGSAVPATAAASRTSTIQETR